MITKGEIQSIDYTGNTCVVRLPYFESAGLTDKIFAEATISNQPGMYNGYKAGDVVFVAFDDGEADQPVVLGKLYLGATKEQKDPRGVMNAESSIISSNMSLPLSTKLVYDVDGSMAQNGQTRYDSIADIANKLADLTKQQSKGFVSKVETKYHLGNSNIEAPTDIWDNWSDNFSELTPTETLKYTWQWTKTWTKTIDYETNTFLDECEDKKTCITGVKGEKGEKGDEGIGVYSEKIFYLAWPKSSDNPPEKINVEDINKTNYNNGAITSGDNNWKASGIDSTNNDNNIYACLVTQLQDANGKFSYTVGDVSKDSAYALAQGKSTNYYSGKDPVSEGYSVKDGDCWFNTGYRIIGTYDNDGKLIEPTSFDSKDAALEVNNNSEKYVYIESKFQKLDEYTGEFTDSTIVYETGTLYQRDASQWKDVGDELVKNKITTNYLNAKEITAKKIVVLDNTQELLTVNGDIDEAKRSLVSIGTDGLNIGYNTKSDGSESDDSETSIKNNQLNILTDGSVWGKHLYIEQTDKHNEDQTASSYFDGNICGHQMKVDTVELATTNTGDGTDQTEGFRHEYYGISACNQNTDDKGVIISFSLKFGIKNLTDTRETDDTETASDDAVWAVLSNKTIGVSLHLEVYIDENYTKTKSITLSTNGTLRGYPYKMSDFGDREVSDVQEHFKKDTPQSAELIQISINNDNHRLMQKKWTINKNITDDKAEGTIKDYEEGTATEIAELSNITCYGISKVDILEITPKEEEYFTGDFYATTGFFKNKYTNFTTGMITDVFSLPWKRIYTDSNGNSVDLPVPMQLLTIIGRTGSNTHHYLYKELRQGDFCTICTGDTTNILEYLDADDQGNRNHEFYHFTATYGNKVWTNSNYYAFTEKDCGDTTTELSGEEVLPGLQNFTNISNINLNLIRKNINITSDGSSLSLGDNWGAQNVGSFPEVFGNSITVTSNYINTPNYSIKVSSYGNNCYSYQNWQKKVYGLKGVTISMYIDKVGSYFTNNGITSDKIYVFCSRSGYLYTLNGETWMKKNRPISAMTGDTISLSIYGNNNKTTINTTNNNATIVQSISTRYSGSYLSASKYSIAQLESNSSVSAWNTQITPITNALYTKGSLIVDGSTSINTEIDKSKLTPIVPTNSNLNKFNISN